VERRGGWVNVKFHRHSKVEPAKLMDLLRRVGGAQFTPAGVLRLPAGMPEAPAALLGRLGEQLGSLAR
jgi:hypothetical protein